MIDPEKLLEECQAQIERSELPGDYFLSRLKMVQGTLPQMLLENYRDDPQGLSMRKKDFGIWNTFTWAQVYDNIKALALGLKSLGMERGDKVCIIGDNDPEWYWTELAVHCVGGVAVDPDVFLEIPMIDKSLFSHNIFYQN